MNPAANGPAPLGPIDPLLPFLESVFLHAGVRRTTALKMKDEGRIATVKVGRLLKVRQSELARFVRELEAA